LDQDGKMKERRSAEEEEVEDEEDAEVGEEEGSEG
jgi:hypothetical protein